MKPLKYALMVLAVSAGVITAIYNVPSNYREGVLPCGYYAMRECIGINSELERVKYTHVLLTRQQVACHRDAGTPFKTYKVASAYASRNGFALHTFGHSVHDGYTDSEPSNYVDVYFKAHLPKFERAEEQNREFIRVAARDYVFNAMIAQGWPILEVEEE